MASRPPGVDRDEWRAARDRVWRQRNWVFNGFMLLAIAALLWRSFF